MSESSQAFDAIVRAEGLKAVPAWRDRSYDERLARDEPRRDPERSGEVPWRLPGFNWAP